MQARTGSLPEGSGGASKHIDTLLSGGYGAWPAPGVPADRLSWPEAGGGRPAGEGALGAGHLVFGNGAQALLGSPGLLLHLSKGSAERGGATPACWLPGANVQHAWRPPGLPRGRPLHVGVEHPWCSARLAALLLLLLLCQLLARGMLAWLLAASSLMQVVKMD